ncbi:MAG: hypothetical protein AAFZ18_24420, partial [Myxococcota bacterium]
LLAGGGEGEEIGLGGSGDEDSVREGVELESGAGPIQNLPPPARRRAETAALGWPRAPVCSSPAVPTTRWLEQAVFSV